MHQTRFSPWRRGESAWNVRVTSVTIRWYLKPVVGDAAYEENHQLSARMPNLWAKARDQGGVPWQKACVPTLSRQVYCPRSCHVASRQHPHGWQFCIATRWRIAALAHEVIGLQINLVTNKFPISWFACLCVGEWLPENINVALNNELDDSEFNSTSGQGWLFSSYWPSSSCPPCFLFISSICNPLRLRFNCFHQVLMFW